MMPFRQHQINIQLFVCTNQRCLYDYKKKDEVRIFFINLKHTHLDITELECDPDDDEYEDGIFQGLSTLMNFAESALNETAEEKGQLDVKIIKSRDGDELKNINKCIVNPGGHHCIIRYPDINEASAYTVFMSTPISLHMPRLYGMQNKQVIVEDIIFGFNSP